MKQWFISMLKAVLPMAKAAAQQTANKVDDGVVELIELIVSRLEGDSGATPEKIEAAFQMIQVREAKEKGHHHPAKK